MIWISAKKGSPCMYYNSHVPLCVTCPHLIQPRHVAQKALPRHQQAEDGSHMHQGVSIEEIVQSPREPLLGDVEGIDKCPNCGYGIHYQVIPDGCWTGAGEGAQSQGVDKYSHKELGSQTNDSLSLTIHHHQIIENNEGEARV